MTVLLLEVHPGDDNQVRLILTQFVSRPDRGLRAPIWTAAAAGIQIVGRRLRARARNIGCAECCRGAAGDGARSHGEALLAAVAILDKQFGST